MKTILLFIILSLSVTSMCLGQQDSLKVKAFHIDLRIQVIKMPALKKLAHELHEQGINTLVMEWEASFPYDSESVISNKHAYTRDEIKDFIAYCNGLHIDVIPLQQTFGHVEYILRHYKYAALREDNENLSQVCPVELILNRTLFTKLIKDMVSLHTSPYVHIGGDETFLLGHCEKCKKKVAEEGLSKLYFNHIKMICDIVTELGKKPVLWADIALKYPEYIHLLPKGTVFVDWNYGWDLNLFGDHSKLVASGYEIWGAPAIRSEPDNFYLEQWHKHFENIRTFIPQARAFGYSGMVMTSWSTSGAYSTVFDSNNDPLVLYPVRRVYPLSGFNLLIAAYTKALQSSQPISIDSFIQKYCYEHYSLNKDEVDLFKQALFTTPYPVINGKVKSDTNISLAILIDSVKNSVRTLNGLKPTKNTSEFEHYRLMSEIRLYYLKVLQLEADLNSNLFTNETKSKYKPVAVSLEKESEYINKRFDDINKDYLNAHELAEEKQLRNQKLTEIYDKLMR